MIGVLYYGRTCTHSQDLLRKVSQQGLSRKLKFVPVDKRERRGEQTLAILDNGSRVLIPPAVTAVPALLDIRDKNVHQGPLVSQRLAAEAERLNRAATGAEREPLAFSEISGGSDTGTAFTFISDDPETLLAQGSGGTQRESFFAGVNDNIRIGVSENDESGGESKVTDSDYEALLARRAADLPQNNQRPPPGAELPPPEKV